MAAATAVQSFAMKVLFKAIGEDPINRTAEDYNAIRSRMPKRLKQVQGLINDYLEMNKISAFSSEQFCIFKAGDTEIRFESYPTWISIETVRQALIVYGWRPSKAKRSPTH